MTKRPGGNRAFLSLPFAMVGLAASLAGLAANGSAAPAPAGAAAPSGPDVQVVAHEADRRVDITIDGKPFTSYMWPTTLKKPVLFPLRSAAGTVLTRSFPPATGERADHPHHVGLWFNYGNVNGFDFWNNSDAIPAEQAPKMGTIEQRAIVSTKSGAGRGELEVQTDWIQGDKTLALKEDTRFVFHAAASDRIIDRITTLTAQDKPVVFGDSKEGVLGMRVRRQLEEPSNEPAVFVDSAGRQTKVAALDNTGVNGVYLTSEGIKGGAAWGTRGRWCALSGTVDHEPVTIVIFDHPRNPHAPTFWHARGYGLFAANPLGAQEFDKKLPKQETTIPAKGQMRFVYRILLLHGPADPADLESRYKQFTKDLQ